MTTNQQQTSEHPVHIHFLLDRSGSMAAMAPDVIGGFNGFLRNQQAHPGFGRMTLVQFDSGDPFEVLTDGLALPHVRSLSGRTFQPRGGTPLWDAVGELIIRASVRAEMRRAMGKRAEETVVAVYTDGEENQSARFDGHSIRRLIEAKKEQGWTFVFLGAGLDAYAEGGRIGVGVGSTQSFAPDGHGARLAFSELDHHMSNFRAAGPAARQALKGDFFADHGKVAEADRRRRYEP
ncbi:MAG: hypothetical protein AVDCRST_MAG50-2447 [uncultured Acidimicrobiales bacterium]|uniref:VWFA domain-containing protein n=1 Tax=uncultured Acidimicrobiales bacterium TaxID=310071 RepID=A0A6J4ILS5_9ACTN|nr:MAG: hypothetical protein AVDCRST_MAG50-2447 [uncultured Acidimicrobiales bacterium]